MAELQPAAVFYTATFNLDEKVQWLELQCIDAAAAQERSAKTRKLLSEETKQTKKVAAALTDSQAVTDSFSKLLRTYQSEIDVLSKRAKTAESTVSELYRSLYQAPNPGPLLTQAVAVEQVVLKQKLENSNLQVELAEFETEFAKLKNQDITIRELTDRVNDLQKQLAEKDKVQEEAHELLREQLVEDLDAKRDLEELRLQLQQMEHDYEDQRRMCETARNDLYEYKFQSEERDQSRQRELDLLQEEILKQQPSSSSILAAEHEIARLRKLDLEEEHKERQRREEEIAQLYQTLDQNRLETSKMRSLELKRNREMEELKQRFAEQAQRDRDRIQELENQASAQSELQKQQQPHSNGRMKTPSMDESENDRSRLVASMENLNAKLRLALAKKETQVNTMQQTILKMEEQIQDSNEMVRKLQEQTDLTSAVSPRNLFLNGGGPSSPLPTEQSHEIGVIGILQEQRDRFRKRMLELEQELETSSTKEKRAKEQLERLKQDNSALTERVRVVRTRNEFTIPTTVKPGSRSPLHLTVRFLSASSLARTALAIYFIILHVLVFFAFSLFSMQHGGVGVAVVGGNGATVNVSAHDDMATHFLRKGRAGGFETATT